MSKTDPNLILTYFEVQPVTVIEKYVKEYLPIILAQMLHQLLLYLNKILNHVIMMLQCYSIDYTPP